MSEIWSKVGTDRPPKNLPLPFCPMTFRQMIMAEAIPKPIPRWDVHFGGLEDDRKDSTEPHIVSGSQPGSQRQCGLAICTFHLGFSLETLPVAKGCYPVEPPPGRGLPHHFWRYWSGGLKSPSAGGAAPFRRNRLLQSRCLPNSVSGWTTRLSDRPRW